MTDDDLAERYTPSLEFKLYYYNTDEIDIKEAQEVAHNLT